MKRYLLMACVCMLAMLTYAQEAKYTFTPIWSPQTQFAGYYVAIEKGFYKEAGLDITIKHVNTSSRSDAVAMLHNGETQIIMQQLARVIELADNGEHLVNILQTSQNSGLRCVANHEIPDIHSLQGFTVGKWKSGHNEIAYIALQKENTTVKWVNFLAGMNLYLSGALDATLCYSFNEYLQILLARGSINPKNVISFADMGYNFPEDGIYVTEDFYNSHKEDLQKFVEATKKGWLYAREHRDEAIDITFKYITQNHIATNLVLQKMQLDEILRLQEDKDTHKATFAPVSESVFNAFCEEMKAAGLIKNIVNYKDIFK